MNTYVIPQTYPLFLGVVRDDKKEPQVYRVIAWQTTSVSGSTFDSIPILTLNGTDAPVAASTANLPRDAFYAFAETQWEASDAAMAAMCGTRNPHGGPR
jgi:hypothetical protein